MREQPAAPLAERSLSRRRRCSWNVSFERGERLALLVAGAEDRAAPDEEAAEGDDERGNAAVGDDEARSGRRSARRGRRRRRGRRPRTYELPRSPSIVTSRPKKRDHPVGLDERHRVAEEAEQRPDRQVDVARHDDQDHARRHDGDRRALDREVPQVAGGQEVAARPEVEGDPDDDQAITMPSSRVSSSVRRQHRAPRARRRRRRRRRARRPGGRGLVRRSNLSHASRLPVRGRAPPVCDGGARPNYRSPGSAAGGDGAGLHALAERRLVDPPGVEDDVEVVLGDRDAARAGST